MSFPNRKWVIIPACCITCIDFENVMQKNTNTLRYSLDNEKTFIKYETSMPDFLSQITGTFHDICNDDQCGTTGWCHNNGVTELNHQEILTILGTTEWTSYDDN